MDIESVERLGTEVVSVLAQRAATGREDALVSAGWVGEMNGPRWMRAGETISILHVEQ